MAAPRSPVSSESSRRAWRRSPPASPGGSSGYRFRVNGSGAGGEATRPLVVARAIRAFADGFASVLLARYLQHLGFSGFRIGAIIMATLLGSAGLTLWAGLRLNRWGSH